MCKFCKRLSHIHETLPFIRVNVEALVRNKVDLVLLAYFLFHRYDEEQAQSDPITLDPKNKLGPGAIGMRGVREQKGRPSPATWK